jgi:hypothetical protein
MPFLPYCQPSSGRFIFAFKFFTKIFDFLLKNAAVSGIIHLTSLLEPNQQCFIGGLTYPSVLPFSVLTSSVAFQYAKRF